MRKPACLLFLPLMFMLMSCGGSGGDTIADYYPFLADTLLVYEGEGHDYASYNVYNTIIRDNRVQKTFYLTGGERASMTTEVLELKDGELRFINGDPYYYHFEDMTRLSPKSDTLMLKEPLRLGAKWDKSTGVTSEVTGVDIELTVPAGTYTVIEVTTSDPANNQVTKEYYAKGIGLIKTIHTIGDMELATSLTEVVTGAPLAVAYNYFFVHPDSGDIHMSQNIIEINTNYDPKTVINTALTRPHEFGVYEPIVAGDIFVGADIDYNAFSARIHLTDGVYGGQFTNESEERDYVQCLALIIGGMLAVDEATVYVNGAPYSGTYYTLPEGEGFVTNYERLSRMLQDESGGGQ